MCHCSRASVSLYLGCAYVNVLHGALVQKLFGESQGVLRGPNVLKLQGENLALELHRYPPERSPEYAQSQLCHTYVQRKEKKPQAVELHRSQSLEEPGANIHSIQIHSIQI